MTIRACVFAALTLPLALAADKRAAQPQFQTSDRCIACHNGLMTSKGEDVSIGYHWRASMMANSSRDPYWRAGVRREITDHPFAKAEIEDECSVCHIPITRYQARLQGKTGQVFAHFPFIDDKEGREAADGVSCSVCHQISAQKLGTRESFNGGFVVEAPASAHARPEYGPFQIDPGQVRIMQSSTGGFEPVMNTDYIRKSEMCATCHTLYTTAFGPDGKPAGSLPEQVPYQEWLHSEYRTTQTCQDCHMPEVSEPVPVTRVFGVPREGVKKHAFVAANFFMLRMLNRYRDDLEVDALPQELTEAAQYTVEYLKRNAARVSIDNLQVQTGRLQAEVLVENLGGHKLPTAYPSRRAWLHVSVRDRNGRVLFESGAVRPDGSITGNDNDADARRFEPHYAEISSGEQVQIYEDIMGDVNGQVTTGLLAAARYLKDNRLLPRGFDKRTAEKDVAVVGEALEDANFAAGGDRVRYLVNLGEIQGPVRVEAELWYQSIGYRWANNLKSYNAAEPRRFTGYFDAMSQGSAEVLAQASATR